MLSPNPRRSPRQNTRKSLAFPLPPGTPTSHRENAPLHPSPLRNEIGSVKRKRARSLGGADDTTSVKIPRKKRHIVPIPVSLVVLREYLTVVGARQGDTEETGGFCGRTYCYWRYPRSIKRRKG